MQLHEERRPPNKWGDPKILNAPGWIDLERRSLELLQTSAEGVQRQQGIGNHLYNSLTQHQQEPPVDDALMSRDTPSSVTSHTSSATVPNNHATEEEAAETKPVNPLEVKTREVDFQDNFGHLTWKLVSPRTAKEKRERKKKLRESMSREPSWENDPSFNSMHESTDGVVPVLKSVYTLLINIPYTHYIYIGGLMFQVPRGRRRDQIRAAAALQTKLIAEAAQRVGIWRYQETMARQESSDVNDVNSSEVEKNASRAITTDAEGTISDVEPLAPQRPTLSRARCGSVDSVLPSFSTTRKQASSRSLASPESSSRNTRESLSTNFDVHLKQPEPVPHRKSKKPSVWTIRPTPEGFREACAYYYRNESKNEQKTIESEHTIRDPGLTPVRVESFSNRNATPMAEHSPRRSYAQALLGIDSSTQAYCEPEIYGPRESPSPQRTSVFKAAQWSLGQSDSEARNSLSLSSSYHDGWISTSDSVCNSFRGSRVEIKPSQMTQDGPTPNSISSVALKWWMQPDSTPYTSPPSLIQGTSDALDMLYYHLPQPRLSVHTESQSGLGEEDRTIHDDRLGTENVGETAQSSQESISTPQVTCTSIQETRRLPAVTPTHLLGRPLPPIPSTQNVRNNLLNASPFRIQIPSTPLPAIPVQPNHHSPSEGCVRATADQSSNHPGIDHEDNLDLISSCVNAPSECPDLDDSVHLTGDAEGTSTESHCQSSDGEWSEHKEANGFDVDTQLPPSNEVVSKSQEHDSTELRPCEQLHFSSPTSGTTNSKSVDELISKLEELPVPRADPLYVDKLSNDTQPVQSAMPDVHPPSDATESIPTLNLSATVLSPESFAHPPSSSLRTSSLLWSTESVALLE